MKRLARDSTCAQCEPSNKNLCEINETSGLTEGERLSQLKNCRSSHLQINASHCFCAILTNPSCKQSTKKNYGCVKLCNYIVFSFRVKTVNSLPVEIRPQSVSKDHTLFLFFFDPYRQQILCLVGLLRKVGRQERLAYKRKSSLKGKHDVSCHFLLFNSTQSKPLLYVFSAIIVLLFFIYALIFLGLQYDDYLHAPRFHFVVIWIRLHFCGSSVLFSGPIQ